MRASQRIGLYPEDTGSKLGGTASDAAFIWLPGTRLGVPQGDCCCCLGERWWWHTQRGTVALGQERDLRSSVHGTEGARGRCAPSEWGSAFVPWEAGQMVTSPIGPGPKAGSA